jgi:hypothetical protein
MSCCDPEVARYDHHGCCGCGPVCCGPEGFVRRFISKEEKTEYLERYKEELEKEIAGVNERIQEIKRSGK